MEALFIGQTYIDVTLIADEMPGTGAANDRDVVVPVPSCPWSFAPQHNTEPPEIRAHANASSAPVRACK